MKKRGQSSSFDFVMGVVIFISVLSFFIFYLAPKTFASEQIPYSVVQSAWFNLEKQSFFDNYMINETSFSDIDYDSIKGSISESYVFSSNDFCLYTVARSGIIHHFGPDSSSLEIGRDIKCGSAQNLTIPSPACRGNFTSGRSISKMGYSIVSDEFVRIVLLVCGELE